LTLDLESVLLAQALKIVLQHDLPIGEVAPPSRALEIDVILYERRAGYAEVQQFGSSVVRSGTLRNQKTLIHPGAAKVVGTADC
jgi:hypothetical protein